MRFQAGDRVWLTLDDGVCTEGWYRYAKVDGRMVFRHRSISRSILVMKNRVLRRCENPQYAFRDNTDYMVEAALAEGLIR